MDLRIDGEPLVPAAEAAAELEATAKEFAARDRADWEASHREATERALRFGGIGALLVALGALATWARYRPVVVTTK